MKKILVTGGTVFVSRYIAEHFVAQGHEVYVLNRNTRPQSPGVKLVQADRYSLGNVLRGMNFDTVIDTAYNASDVDALLDALDNCGDYVLISSSAVYPDTAPQPFGECTPLGENRYWGRYGTDKIAAEAALLRRRPDAYILRPPYLYGPMNNVYREAFVFDCAMADRPFYLPGDGDMKLQFFHIRDLCRMIDVLLRVRPSQRVFNVGNPKAVSIREWVECCYHAASKEPRFVHVHEAMEQRRYFPFYDYEYLLDVTAQQALMPDTIPLDEGLREAYAWYIGHEALVNKKPLLAFIDEHFTTHKEASP